MERVKTAEATHALLNAEQRRVMIDVLAEEEAHREHVVVYLSGAHAYGFPSPDSDLDLKAIHVAKTADLLGFEVPASTVDRAEIVDGVEIDYTSNELAHALAGALAGNGNFIERVLGRTTAHEGSLLGELRPIVHRALSRRVYRHYRGFAASQLRFLEKEPTAKKLLYVLRTSLTGAHLLGTGTLESDLTRLMDRYGMSAASSLIERKQAGERIALDGGVLDTWRPRVNGLFTLLDETLRTSPLPEEPRNEAEVREWLIGVRRARL